MTSWESVSASKIRWCSRVPPLLPLHCSLTVYHLHKQFCSSLLYSSRIAIHSCICLCVRCVRAHPPQPKHLCVCACCILFYFTFKILTSWIKCFNKRVEIKLFKLIVNLKLHISLSIVSLKLVQLMTESKLVLMVYTCNFNTEEEKAGRLRVWGKPGLRRTFSHKTKQNKKFKISELITGEVERSLLIVGFERL